MFNWQQMRLNPEAWKDRGAVILLMLAGGALFGPDALDALRTYRDDARDAVREQMPLEVELRRVRRMVDDAVPEIRRRREILVRMQMDVEDVEGAVARAAAELERQRAELTRLQSSAAATPEDSRASPEFRTLIDELAACLDLCQVEEATLTSQQDHLQVLRQQQAQAEAAQRTSVQRLRTMMAEVVGLEARLQLQLANQPAEPAPETTNLADCTEQIDYLKRRFDFAERLAAGHAEDALEWQAGTPRDSTDVLADAQSYLARSAAPASTAPRAVAGDR